MKQRRCIAFTKVPEFSDAYLPCTETAMFMAHFCERHQAACEEVLLGIINEGGFQEEYANKVIQTMIEYRRQRHDERTNRNH